MLEKLFNRSFAIILVITFFICAAFYNVGYFSILGDSLWYFLYVPVSIFDIIKTGLFIIFPLALILIIFKPILINPIFMGVFPGAAVLLTIASLVLVSNLLYFAIFIDSSNKFLSLVSESAFYIFSVVCFLAIVYYFTSSLSQQALVIIFLIGLIPIVFIIGVIDAKSSLMKGASESKSQILLSSDKVVSVNILRSFDKGMFLISGSSRSINFVSWDEIKEIKFKNVKEF